MPTRLAALVLCTLVIAACDLDPDHAGLAQDPCVYLPLWVAVPITGTYPVGPNRLTSNSCSWRNTDRSRGVAMTITRAATDLDGFLAACADHELAEVADTELPTCARIGVNRSRAMVLVDDDTTLEITAIPATADDLAILRDRVLALMLE